MQRRTLLTAALAAPLSSTGARAEDALVEAARREGGLSWYNGYIGDTIAQDMAGRFERAYPGVRLSTVRSTSQVAFQRLRQDQQAGLHACDVYSSSDVSHFDDLAREKRLLPHTPANAAKIDPALQGKALYADGQYYPALISMVALAYNSRHVGELLASRGIVVSHETIRQCGLKFRQAFANQIRRRLPRAGDKWHLDEVAAKISGVQHRLWRA